MSIATFNLWKVDHPDGTIQEYEGILAAHNVLHNLEVPNGMPCPFWDCPGWAPEVRKGLIERTMDRLYGREDPDRDYDIYS